jgi:hypothetical protein
MPETWAKKQVEVFIVTVPNKMGLVLVWPIISFFMNESFPEHFSKKFLSPPVLYCIMKFYVLSS